VLAAMMESVKEHRAQLIAAAGKESDRLFAEATSIFQAEDMAGALVLFEASLRASRQEGDRHGVAVNLVMIGQALLALGRVGEAQKRLREGLEVAQEVGDEKLLQAMQQVATVAAARALGR
jgi:thioredoxin-like negative regulator of GroEL